jgi:hypothetical protein
MRTLIYGCVALAILAIRFNLLFIAHAENPLHARSDHRKIQKSKSIETHGRQNSKEEAHLPEIPEKQETANVIYTYEAKPEEPQFPEFEEEPLVQLSLTIAYYLKWMVFIVCASGVGYAIFKQLQPTLNEITKALFNTLLTCIFALGSILLAPELLNWQQYSLLQAIQTPFRIIALLAIIMGVSSSITAWKFLALRSKQLGSAIQPESQNRENKSEESNKIKQSTVGIEPPIFS